MPTVGEFYDDLRRALARGTSDEKSLPVLCRQAVRWLERNRTWSYMKGSYVVLPLPNSFDFSLNIPRLKALEEAGYLGADGGMVPMGKISRASAHGFGGDRPAQFWTEGGKIKFVGKITEPYPFLLRVAQFSEWPEKQSETHDLLDLADDLVKYQVLWSAAAERRDANAMTIWKALRDEALVTATNSDEEAEAEGNSFMEYRGGTGNLYPSGSEAIGSISGLIEIPGILGVAGLFYVGP